MDNFELLKYRYEYDNQNRVTKVECYSHQSSEFPVLDTWIYYYEGNTRRSEEYSNGKLSDYYDITEYDVDGKEIKNTTYNASGIQRYSIEEYDSEGHNIKRLYYDGDGKLTSYEEMEWVDDKLIEYNKYYASKKLESSTTYKRDRYGNTIMATFNDMD